MGEQKPETKDWLGHHIEDSIADNLGIDTKGARSVGKTPDAIQGQQSHRKIENYTAYMGYMVQRTRVKPAMAVKKVPVLLSLAIAC